MERDSATASAPHITTPRPPSPSPLLHPHPASSPHVPPPHPHFSLASPRPPHTSSPPSRILRRCTFLASLLLRLSLPPPIEKSRPLSITSSADLSLSITYLTPAQAFRTPVNTLRPPRPSPPYPPRTSTSGLLLHSSPSATPFFPSLTPSIHLSITLSKPTLASLSSPRRVGFQSLSLRPVEPRRSWPHPPAAHHSTPRPAMILALLESCSTMIWRTQSGSIPLHTILAGAEELFAWWVNDRLVQFIRCWMTVRLLYLFSG